MKEMFVEIFMEMLVEKMFVEEIFVKEIFVKKRFIEERFVRKMMVSGGSPSAEKIVDNFWEVSKHFGGRRGLGGVGYEKRTEQLREPDRSQKSKGVKGAKRVMEHKEK